MAGRRRRTSSWILLAVFAVGIAAAAGPALAATDGCCADMAAVSAPPCQWLTPAACCDSPLAVQGATQAPAPPASARAMAVEWPPAPETALRAGGMGFVALGPAPLIRTVILRL